MSRLALVSQPEGRPEQPTASDTILVAAKGGSIAFAGNMVAYLSRFAFAVVLGRSLGAALVGTYSLTLTLVEMAAELALLGLSASMAYFIPIAVRRRDPDRIWGVIQTGLSLPLVFSLCLATAMFVGAESLAIGVFGEPSLVPMLRWGSLGIPLTALLLTMAAMTQGFKRMEYKVYAQDIALNVLKFVIFAAVAVAGLGVLGALVSHIVASAIAVIMFLFFLNRLFPLNRPVRSAKHNMGEIFRFSVPLYLSQMVNQFSSNIETVVLGIFGIMSGVGVYTTALRLSLIGTVFHQSLQRIGVPMISDLYHAGQHEQLKRLYHATTKWDMAFNLPVFMTTLLFAKPLLSIFGNDFIVGASGMIILAFATMFNASTGFCGSMVSMTGRSKLTFANSVVCLVINILLDLLLIPRWGSLGAAIAASATTVLINLLRTAEVYILLKMWPHNGEVWKLIVAGAVAVSVAYPARQGLASWPMLWQLAAGMVIVWGVYALIIVLLGLSREDRLILSRLKGRLGLRPSAAVEG